MRIVIFPAVDESRLSKLRAQMPEAEWVNARSEQEVFQRFAELTKGKMALLISHRFSTVKMTDRIVVLSQGVLTEEGTHEELIRHGGLYAEMFEMQAASYR